MATDQMWCDTTEREQRVNCTTEQLIPESLPTKPKISEHIIYTYYFLLGQFVAPSEEILANIPPRFEPVSRLCVLSRSPEAPGNKQQIRNIET